VNKATIEGENVSEMEQMNNSLPSSEQKIFREIPTKYDEPGSTPLEIAVKDTSNQFALDIPDRIKEQIRNGGL
jgi:hypothetical protein